MQTLKDYYYILGVKVESTQAEINQVYTKLSLKFHPDKNEGDKFFKERFKEIKEAFDTLNDPFKRTEYEKRRSILYSNLLPNLMTMPLIARFTCNKSDFTYVDEVVFSWKVYNGDVVSILPIGLVEIEGQMTYKIKDYKNESLKFELIVENSLTNKKASSILVLTNETHQEMKIYFSSLSIINWIKVKKLLYNFANKDIVFPKYWPEFKMSWGGCIVRIIMIILFLMFFWFL